MQICLFVGAGSLPMSREAGQGCQTHTKIPSPTTASCMTSVQSLNPVDVFRVGKGRRRASL